MKKVILLLLLFPLLPFACETDGCKTSRYFNTIGVKLIPMAAEAQANGNVNYKTIYQDDSAAFSQFYFDGYLNAEYYARQQKPAFSIFPQAYATDCASPGYDGSEEKVAAVHLIALGFYNANFRPGDTLTKAMLINDKPAAQYVAENSNRITDQFFTIKLLQRPNPKEMQAFKLIYQLTNGETYEVYTPRFKLY